MVYRKHPATQVEWQPAFQQVLFMCFNVCMYLDALAVLQQIARDTGQRTSPESRLRVYIHNMKVTMSMGTAAWTYVAWPAAQGSFSD